MFVPCDIAIHDILLIWTEDVCKFNTLPGNATINAQSGVYGDVITSTRNYGYSFINHSSSEFIECLEFGVWSKVPETCHRKEYHKAKLQ